MKLIRNTKFLEEFNKFVGRDFLVGIEFGGAILAAMNMTSRHNNQIAMIRKDGTICGNLIPKSYVLLDDVITTENSVRRAMEQLYKQIGKYPDEVKCIVDRRYKKNKLLHIESMLEWNEE